MATIEITVCDVCGQLDLPTRAYSVTSAWATVQVDLCEEHSRPLDAILNSKPRTKNPQPPAVPATGMADDATHRSSTPAAMAHPGYAQPPQARPWPDQPGAPGDRGGDPGWRGAGRPEDSVFSQPLFTHPSMADHPAGGQRRGADGDGQQGHRPASVVSLDEVGAMRRSQRRQDDEE